MDAEVGLCVAMSVRVFLDAENGARPQGTGLEHFMAEETVVPEIQGQNANVVGPKKVVHDAGGKGMLQPLSSSLVGLNPERPTPV
ncbi:hypothetical protein J6590_060252 [Homalodisca vitripennis]|nr:hypothetical protein J6590_060252 [Homalodisca vitripennis]